MYRGTITLFGIAGGSRSGKSSAARRCADIIGSDRVSILHLDDYYLHPSIYSDSECGFVNWDSPNALDWNRISIDLAALSQGKIVRPPYKSSLYHDEGGNPVTTGDPVLPAEIVIVEGLYTLLYADIYKHMKSSAFIDVSDQVRQSRHRRLIANNDYVQMVQIPMHRKHLEPTKATASILIAADEMTEGQLADRLVDWILAALHNA